MMASDALDVSPFRLLQRRGLIVDSVARIPDALDCCRWSYEVVFVDDCSKDKTRADRAIGCRTSHTPSRPSSTRKTRDAAPRLPAACARAEAPSSAISISIWKLTALCAGMHSMRLSEAQTWRPGCAQSVFHALDRSLYSESRIHCAGHTALGVDAGHWKPGSSSSERADSANLRCHEAQHWFWDTEVMVFGARRTPRLS